MFEIEGTTIHVTRGDICAIMLSAPMNDGSGVLYTFQPGDVIRLSVMQKGRCDIILAAIDTEVVEPSSSVMLYLSSEDTRIGEVINAPTEYWYEIELNPDTSPQSIICYDRQGPKKFMLYPEGVGSQ